MSAIRIVCMDRLVNVQKFSQFLNQIYRLRISHNLTKYYTTEIVDAQAEKMQNMLQKRFPKASKIIVNDMSGGCGSMYEIFVETVEFKGLPLVKQHMLINETLKEQIKDMHGLTVKTKVPDTS